MPPSGNHERETMPKYSELKGKIVIAKVAYPPAPLVGEIVEVESEGIWIKAEVFGDGHVMPTWEAAATFAAAITNQVVFIPLCQIHYLVASAD